MPPTSLFSNEPDNSNLPNPGAPSVWLKRLVLVRERHPIGEFIRDIRFRLGLNIIDTPEGSSQERKIVGHNVGKTLLVRLIRYCLGDKNFAARPFRQQIQNHFQEGYVLAEVCVDGSNWAIARPFGVRAASWAISEGVCEQLLEDSKTFADYEDFRSAIQTATLGQLPVVELSHARRTPVWTDLLGWLARDQRCRFKHHCEWREPGMDAGPPTLQVEDANLLTRLVMGVLDPTEQELNAQIDDQRRQLKSREEERNGLEQRIVHTRFHLIRRLELSAELPIDGLFAATAREHVRSLQEGVQREFEELVARSDLESYEADRLRTSRELAAAEARLDEMAKNQHWIESRLRQAEADQKSSKDASYAQLLKCDLPECPLGKVDRPPGKSDEHFDSLVDELRQELKQSKSQSQIQRETIEAMKRKEGESSDRFRHRKSQYDASLKQIQLLQGQYELLNMQIGEYETDIRNFESTKSNCEKLNTSIESLLEERGAFLDKHSRKFTKLKKCYEEVIEQLLPEAKGSLVLNNKVGLSPRNEEISGEAISTAGQVVGFDLACLLGSIHKLGSHPRFMIHDSPREADLEKTAYFRIFEWAADLEKRFTGEPPFQYILTTTTPPPPDLAREPYVRLSLDARDVDGLLLKVRF